MVAPRVEADNALNEHTAVAVRATNQTIIHCKEQSTAYVKSSQSGHWSSAVLHKLYRSISLLSKGHQEGPLKDTQHFCFTTHVLLHAYAGKLHDEFSWSRERNHELLLLLKFNQ
jgi:hypothetical protein